MYTIDKDGILHAVDEDSVRTATKGDPPKTLCHSDAGEILKLPPENVRLCVACADLLNPGAATAQRTASKKKQAPLVEEFRAPSRIKAKRAPKSLPGQIGFSGAVWDGKNWVIPEEKK